MLGGMDEVRQRLKEALDTRRIPYAEASRHCRRNHAYIQQYLERNTPRRLPEEVRHRLADLLGMDERELRPPRAGEGTRSNGPTAVSGFEPRYKGHIPGSQPEITGAAGAGPGEMPEDAIVVLNRGDTVSGHLVKAEWFFPPDYLRHELGSAPSTTWIYKVLGDSMSPSLETNDRVLIDTSHSTPVPDGIYLIDEGHGPLVKRVNFIRRSDPPEYEIISDNEIHHRYNMLADQVRIIGRVCGRVTRM